MGTGVWEFCGFPSIYVVRKSTARNEFEDEAEI